jgi:hypothetical protein
MNHTILRFHRLLTLSLAAFLLAAAQLASAQSQVVITLLPVQPDALAAPIGPADFSLKIEGKPAAISGVTPLQGADQPLEIVFLIDNSVTFSMASQLSTIGDFFKELPTHARIAVAYMENGRGVLAAPLSDNPASALAALRVPNGSPSSSHYFCLSDLANKWPSTNPGSRRVVVLITNGVDSYNPRFDPDDPYLQAAIHDSVRARLQVYSLYWQDRGGPGVNQSNTGQNLLSILAEATGAQAYYQGPGNPVSFEPFLNDLRARLRNQYLLSFIAPFHPKPTIQSLQLKLSTPHLKLTAPHQVFIPRNN